MINYELTDQLIELESIQRDFLLNRARGQVATELLDHYKIRSELYSLAKEKAEEGDDNTGRRTIVRFNFGQVKDEEVDNLVECLFFLGHTPDFISEAMGIHIKTVAQALCKVIQENRAKKAAKLRANPQRFRLISN